jgi:hypothetical protein
MHEQMAILISELDYAMIEKYFNINSQKEYSRCKEPLSMCIKNNPGIALSDLLSAHFNPNDLLALLKKFNQIDSHLAKLISTNKIDLSVIDKLIEIRNDICH